MLVSACLQLLLSSRPSCVGGLEQQVLSGTPEDPVDLQDARGESGLSLASDVDLILENISKAKP